MRVCFRGKDCTQVWKWNLLVFKQRRQINSLFCEMSPRIMRTLCLSQSFQSSNWPGNELTNKAGENIFIFCRISRENVVKSDVGAWFLILSIGDSILIQHV